ncbi:MAG: M23 family metallopeptidase [Acidobacteriaceae bacterium]|nr:M23 family metallopeptidase [Acidobacteriaceae bacterium]
MSQGYFVLEFAHSVHGRVKRIQLSYRSLLYIFGSFLLLAFVLVFLFSSYVSMSWKAHHYNELSANFERLRTRYQELQRQSLQHSQQMASLETLASEVSAAYGISPPELDHKLVDWDSLNVKESIEEYNFLKAATYSNIEGHHYVHAAWRTYSQPSLWPVIGALSSSFGGRWDPFSGEGAFHTGVDLQAPRGTPVHVTADGVVENAGWSGSYGKLVVVDHGGGLETYYAHLSQLLVVPGEDLRRGQILGLSGGTGRATGPHVHYEVRMGGTPVNPYKFMSKPQVLAKNKPAHNDFGL